MSEWGLEMKSKKLLSVVSKTVIRGLSIDICLTLVGARRDVEGNLVENRERGLCQFRELNF